MSLFEYLKQSANETSIKITEAITYETLSVKHVLTDVDALIEKNPSRLIIDCANIKHIDCCGLALLLYIIKALPNTKTTLQSTSDKLEKMRALYVCSNEHL